MLTFISIKTSAFLNQPPDFFLDRFLENLWLLIPAFAFCTFFLGFSGKLNQSMLGVKLWIIDILGGHFTLEAGLSVYSELGPGIGTANIIGIILLVPSLLAGNFG